MDTPRSTARRTSLTALLLGGLALLLVAAAPFATFPPSLSVDGDGAVTVSWDAAERAETYEVLRSTVLPNGRWGDHTTVATTAATSVVDRPGDGTHRYKIVAVNADGVNHSGSTQITVEGSSSDGDPATRSEPKANNGRKASDESDDSGNGNGKGNGRGKKG